MKHFSFASHGGKTALFFLFLFALLTLRLGYRVDNDTWYLLALGRAIAADGIPVTDPLLMDAAVPVVIQQWAYAFCLYKIFAAFGIPGIYLVSLALGFLTIFLFYRLCLLVSEENHAVSMVLTAFVAISYAVAFNGIVERPQTLSSCVLVLAVFLLERYARGKGRRGEIFFVLLLSPLLSNFHAAIWPLLPCVILPFLVEQFLPVSRCAKLREIFLPPFLAPRWPLCVIFLSVLLFGFLNPYGFGALSYSTAAQGLGPEFHRLIREMQPLDALRPSFYFVLGFLLPLLVCFARQKFPVRSLLLTAGTAFMAFVSLRSSVHFLLLGTFPLAYFARGAWRGESGLLRRLQNIPLRLVIFFLLLELLLCLLTLKRADFAALFSLPPLAHGFALLVFAVATGAILWRFHKNKKQLLAGLLTGLLLAYFSLNGALTFAGAASQNREAFPALEALTAATEKRSDLRLYTDFNDGAAAEFFGFRPYMDTRPEIAARLPARAENGNRWLEFCHLRAGRIYAGDFLAAYQFDVLLVGEEDPLFACLPHDAAYQCVYHDAHRKIYRRVLL